MFTMRETIYPALYTDNTDFEDIDEIVLERLRNVYCIYVSGYQKYAFLRKNF